MDNNLPKRKTIRLRKYDYKQAGIYFVTICTEGRQCVLSEISPAVPTDFVGEGLCALPKPILTPIGIETEKAILHISENAGYEVDKYVIMPNHVHILISVSNDENKKEPPSLNDVIGRLKSYTTHEYGKLLWQRSFYDHIVRDQSDYQNIWAYIDTNAAKWREDRYYSK